MKIKKRFRWFRFILFSCLLSFQGCRYEKIEPIRGECSAGVSYSAQINIIIQTHCATPGCHVTGFLPGDFTTYEGLKAKADNGRLRQLVLELRNMPPDSSITEEERQAIGCWIQQGAADN